MPDTPTDKTTFSEVVIHGAAQGRVQKRMGRPPGVRGHRARRAAEIAQDMGVDPIAFLLSLVKRTCIRVPQYNQETGKLLRDADGKVVYKLERIPLDIQTDAAKTVAKYLHPQISAIQITGKDEGPIAVAYADVTRLMLTNPAAASAAQDLALAMVSDPAQKQLPSAPEAITIDTEVPQSCLLSESKSLKTEDLDD